MQQKPSEAGDGEAEELCKTQQTETLSLETSTEIQHTQCS